MTGTCLWRAIRHEWEGFSCADCAAFVPLVADDALAEIAALLDLHRAIITGRTTASSLY